MSRRRSERAVAAACSLIAELGIEAPEDIDLELIAALLGAHVEWLPLTNEHAHVRRIGDHLFIGLAETSRTSKKWRHDLGHEIGHLRLHGENEVVSCPSVALRRGDVSEEERKLYWKTEGEAGDFSVELLHHEPFVRPMLDVPASAPFTLDDVSLIADRFDMSLTSTAYRCTELTRAACAFAVSRDGLIEQRAMSDAFAGKIVKGRKLRREALATVLREDGERVDGEVDGVAWGGRRGSVMREWSLRARGVVMTWVWHAPGAARRAR